MDTATTLLVFVGIVILAVLGWAGRKRFPLRIGAGNFFRRKTQVAIVVAGLLIGTAIITSSYVIQSTFDYTIRSAVFRSFDEVDEIIFAPTPRGSHGPFAISVFDDLEANRSTMADVAALAPRWDLPGAVIDYRSRLFDPTTGVIGFNASQDLGRFARSDGTSWDGARLGPTDAIINERLADAIEARIGDTLALSMGGPSGPATLLVNVSDVVQNTGRGAWNDGDNVFVRLETLQGALRAPGTINTILVANVGGVAEGYLRSDDVVREIALHLPATPSFTISKAKADAIDQAKQNVDQLSQLFILLGVFTIVAGVLLIINIFVMLAEERKGEMGVARALGMRRSNLVQSFVSEGLFYALLSALVGTFSGLFVAAVILWAFGQIFPGGFGGIGFVLTWTWSDLFQGFAIGFLITMGTIGLASWRVSKLNIVRAIRDIPEPVLHQATRSQIAAGATLATLGLLGILLALSRGNLILQDAGPVSLALGLAVLTMRRLPGRAVFTAAGVATLGWVLSPWKPFSTSEADITLFIVSGLLLVLGGLLIVLFNSDAFLGLASRAVRSRTWRPVVRTAIAYPMNKKFRTGVTLASIALVMFTIATMSNIQELVSSSIETTTVRESAGFDLIAQSGIPIANWSQAFETYENDTASLNITEQYGLSRAQVRMAKEADFGGTEYNTSLLGVPTDWTPYPPFEFQALDPAYANAAAAWAAIQNDTGLAILDGTVVPQSFGPNFSSFPAQLGDRLYYNASGVVRNVRVIGILYERFVPGIWVGWSTVHAEFAIDASSVFYFKVLPGVTPTAAGHDLERYFIQYQFLTFDVRASINDILEVTMGIFNLLEAYLALGLIVGIAGLGVITMRNVVERRQETGALRAIGFRKSMVLRSFLFELSFIALTGIALGNVLGIALSYDIYLRFFATQAAFIVPWARLAILGGIAFVGSVLATASPAVRAARMPPAQALRTFE